MLVAECILFGMLMGADAGDGGVTHDDGVADSGVASTDDDDVTHEDDGDKNIDNDNDAADDDDGDDEVDSDG